MTVVVPSHQQREALERLLAALSRELEDAPLRSGLDAVVVLDGSQDGSKEMLASLDFPVPLTVIAQDHCGLASARNCGLKAAEGELVWFLDSDLVPHNGSLARHRRAHLGEREAVVVVGATPIPANFRVPAELRDMTECHAGLSEATDIDTFDLVPFANVSAPAWLLEELGGFDEGFTEYGFEEYDLGARLLEQGVRIRFEPDATAWHYTTATDPELIRHRNRAAGRNAVRFARRHPACADRVFGSKAAWRAMRLFGRLGLTSSGSLDAVSTASALVGRVVALFVRGSYRPHRFSWAAAFAAGVADLDEQQEFLPLLLSRPGLARPRHQRRR